jgi:hypothetical protein
MNATAIDSEWFHRKAKDNHLTTRRLGELLGLNYSAVSRMFNGKQGIRAQEAAELARHFLVPVEEVMQRAGIEVLHSVCDGVAVAGWFDGQGLGHGPEGLLGPGKIEDVPQSIPSKANAYHGQGGLSDGCYFLVDEADDRPGVLAEAVGRLCVVRMRGEAGCRLRWLGRGYKAGEWSLVSFDGSIKEPGRLVSATPVLWVRQ